MRVELDYARFTEKRRLHATVKEPLSYCDCDKDFFDVSSFSVGGYGRAQPLHGQMDTVLNYELTVISTPEQ